MTSTEKEILDFFADRNFERSRRFARDAYDPRHLRHFLNELGNPQFAYQTIHVAGTVGKGSATTYLARALGAMGFKTGAYLSPHFVSLTERFTAAGAAIDDETLARLWSELKVNTELETLSFFDAMTALGFLFFARAGCAWAVVETGLGGRLDSTNNLHAEIAVITRIGLDHQKILGDTIEKIAFEKAGIIHPGQKVYSVTQEAGALEVLQRAADEAGATLRVIGTTGETFVEANRNFARAVVADAFHPPESVAAAIERELALPLFGRWSVLRESPRIIFDGGHNAAAMTALVQIVNRQPEAECNIFLNTMRERDLGEFCRILAEGIRQKVSLYLLSVSDKQYYSEVPDSAALRVVGDDEIRQLLSAQHALHLFTGSMGIYSELKTRFAL